MESDDSHSDTDGRNRLGASLLSSLLRRTGRLAEGTLDMALDATALSAMFGEGWLRNAISAGASPERLEAMAEAGHFLRDARETAGLSIAELSERLELRDASMLEGVERGDTLLPLELALRAASLLARHDPIPFLIRFMRSYNPQIEARLENWGVLALPRTYERERRFINLYRQHDYLRDLTDEEHERFIDYMDASTRLVVEVMMRERASNPRRTTKRGPRRSQRTEPSRRRKAEDRGAEAASKPPAAAKQRDNRSASAGRKEPTVRKPVVRKVRPKTRAKDA